MSRMMSKRDDQDRQNGQQSCFACDQQMRHCDIAKLPLDHEQEAGNSSLRNLMSAEDQSKLMPFIQERAKFHSIGYQSQHSSYLLGSESTNKGFRFTEKWIGRCRTSGMRAGGLGSITCRVEKNSI